MNRTVGWSWAGIALALLSTGCADAPHEDEDERARGAELYERHCVECHGGATGGEISDIPPPHNAEGHTWHHADCELVEITLEGLPPRDDHPQMPAFGDRLDEDDVQAILAHIKTWWEPDQLRHQAQVTEELCH